MPEGLTRKSLPRDLDEWPVSDLDDDPTLWIEPHPAAAQLTSGQRGEGERMDLVEYGRVVRRQAILVLIGLTITFALMFLSLVRVSGDGMVFRQPPIYQARSELLVTQAGFPVGRAAPPDYQQADSTRMDYLAGLYAELAMSETVRTVIQSDGTRLPLPRSSYEVTQVVAPMNQRTFPLIEVAGIGTSEGMAMAVANRVARGLKRFILVNQNRNRVPKAERVDLRVVTTADRAEVLQGVKLTTPMMLFMLGLVVTLACAFARDNVKRNRRGPDSQIPLVEHPVGQRVELESVPEEPAVPRRITGTHDRFSNQVQSALDQP